MNWGHGFVPRIHAGNYHPVDRSLEPPTLDGSHFSDLANGTKLAA